MKQKLKDILKYTAAFALTVFLLYFAFRGLDWDAFVDGLRSCNYWWIFAAMAAGVLGTVLRGLRWRLLLLPIDPSVRRVDCFNAYAVCYLSNIAVLRSGELVRCGMIASSSKVPFKDSLGSVMVERAWDVAVSAAIILWMVLFTRFGGYLNEIVWKPFLDSLSFNSLRLLIAGIVLLSAAVWLIVHFKEKIMSSRLGNRVISFCRGIFNGIKAAFKMKHGFLFIAYTIIVQVLYWLEIVFVIKAFPAVSHLTGMDAMFIMSLALIGWAVPVQGGFGAYHVIVSMALVPIYGIDQSTALVFATISHEAQIVQMIVVGFAALALALSLKKKRQNKTQTI
ncbi:MAG: flippase-like domain-containing protein [Bacteroidales bacterium]|nr:flippase-like domain-containing protein [Bacteroidales bacterium]